METPDYPTLSPEANPTLSSEAIQAINARIIAAVEEKFNPPEASLFETLFSEVDDDPSVLVPTREGDNPVLAPENDIQVSFQGIWPGILATNPDGTTTRLNLNREKFDPSGISDHHLAGIIRRVVEACALDDQGEKILTGGLQMRTGENPAAINIPKEQYTRLSQAMQAQPDTGSNFDDLPSLENFSEQTTLEDLVAKIALAYPYDIDNPDTRTIN